ncbi:hypothetical protein GB931_09495 [Modestobacter sp. I12A-02628]|uniref:DUF1023 domain-containing protein n=1 Tax=Goekera deserti TaxID=2497753 RepID=A0A7K3WL75_9ACTN|nr:alpha/beta hydrolase [Goekera deserti]MPQ98150.1 hypothetical protein [Goekera deserti]NDI48799.1 hypothetical protein [Goekera deserti]NEL56480.1 hypothetical protein [Goekera deserti]
MSAPVPLSAVLTWDVVQLRSSVGTLDLVAGRTGAWRLRLDAVTQELSRAVCWSGPAASAAAGVLVELSTVTSGVEQSLVPSVEQLTLLFTAATSAQELAAQAFAAAAAGPVTLLDDGSLSAPPLLPGSAMAPDQLAALDAMADAGRLAVALAAAAQEQVTQVAAHARGAADALTPLRPGGPAADFADLAGPLAPDVVVLPLLPPHHTPEQAARWWSGLTSAQQYTAIAEQPAVVGGLDGVPAWARDLANRAVLEAEVQSLDTTSERHATAQAVAAQLRAQEQDGRLVQLHRLDLDQGLVGIAIGDLDAAGEVAVFVPGITTTAGDDLDGLGAAAVRIVGATEQAAPGVEAAVLVWLGYRTPGLLTAPFPFAAERGGRALDRALDGLAAARPGPAAARTTVVAHSYGTTVVDHAADEDGALAADAVVLLGSPGVSEWTAGGLEVDEVYDAASPADPVSYVSWFGQNTWMPLWGSEGLPTDITQWHTEYLDADRPTLEAIGEVVAGTR